MASNEFCMETRVPQHEKATLYYIVEFVVDWGNVAYIWFLLQFKRNINPFHLTVWYTAFELFQHGLIWNGCSALGGTYFS